MVCPNCGKQVPDAARFCRGCGGALQAAPPPAAVAAVQPATYPAYPPAYQTPAYPTAPRPASGGPVPSSMHWAVAMLLVMVTFGIFGFILIFQQSSFVKKIDPKSKATTLWVVALLLIVLVIVLIFGAAGFAAIAVQASNGAVGGGLGVGMAGLMGIAMLIDMVAAVLCYIAIFGMRRSLVNYYNTVEPINLRLSAAMTFFFNLYYFQYHFARIAAWKKTGVLH